MYHLKLDTLAYVHFGADNFLLAFSYKIICIAIPCYELRKGDLSVDLINVKLNELTKIKFWARFESKKTFNICFHLKMTKLRRTILIDNVSHYSYNVV